MIFLVFVIAFLVAYAINPVVLWLQHRGANRVFAVISVYFVLILLFLIVWVILLPFFLHDLIDAMRELPNLTVKVQRLTEEFLEKLQHNRFLADSGFLTAEMLLKMQEVFRKWLFEAVEQFLAIFPKLFLLLIVPVVAFYITRDYEKTKKLVARWILLHFGSVWNRIFLKIDDVFSTYIRGQLLVTLAVGTLLTIGFYLLKLKGAFFLGFLAGVLNLIPYFGPVFGIIPALLFALLNSPWQMLWVLLLFLTVNQLESLFLTPKLVGQKLGLHPVFTIFLVLVGGKFWGIPGMILAVPCGSILGVIVREKFGGIR